MMTVPPQLTSSLPSFSYPASFRHPPPASSFFCGHQGDSDAGQLQAHPRQEGRSLVDWAWKAWSGNWSPSEKSNSGDLVPETLPWATILGFNRISFIQKIQLNEGCGPTDNLLLPGSDWHHERQQQIGQMGRISHQILGWTTSSQRLTRSSETMSKVWASSTRPTHILKKLWFFGGGITKVDSKHDPSSGLWYCTHLWKTQSKSQNLFLNSPTWKQTHSLAIAF